MQKTINRIAFKYTPILLLLMLAISLFGHSNVAFSQKIETISPAQPQSEKSPIKIGMSAPLTGGAAKSGNGMRLGIEIYFDKINAEGGIQGRKLELITLDNEYDPLRAASTLHELIDQDHVLAILGNSGTPTAVVTVPIVNENKILLFGAETGSALLRKTPPDRYIINFRASYLDEVRALIKLTLTSSIKPDNIAVFTQNDAYGDSIYQSSIKTLKELGYNNTKTLPHGRYNRNTLNVLTALSQIMEQAKFPIKAFIMGGVDAPNAQFIKLARAEYPSAIFLGVSDLIKANDLDKNASNQVIVSQVVPYTDSNLPAVIEYQENLQKYGRGAKANPASLEGYLVAKLFVMGLKQAATANKLTREGIIDALEAMHNIDFGIGTKINFDKNDHVGLNTTWMTIFRNGKFVPMN